MERRIRTWDMLWRVLSVGFVLAITWIAQGWSVATAGALGTALILAAPRAVRFVQRRSND